ncbi:MAG: M14 family zinc carboxypeptidase, partial [Oceanococcaceae bacterium]
MTDPLLFQQTASRDSWQRLEELISTHGHLLQVRTLAECTTSAGPLPLRSLSIGADRPEIPRLFVMGGVHGNERIGVEVVLSFLHTLLEHMRWNEHFAELFERVRLIVVPIANPTGFAAGTRATAAGIDLMRNAPIESRNAHWLVGGQKLSPWLPWYRGRQMCPELEAITRLFDDETRDCPLTLSLDCHSGFGAVNRIWFPWAH